MTLKNYRRLSFATLAAMAAACVVAVSQNAYWLFAAVVLAGSLVRLGLRRHTPEACADERDREIAGKAASTALQTFGWIGLGAAGFLFYFKDRNPQFSAIAGTLTVAAAAVLIHCELIETYLRRYQYGKLWRFAAFAALLTLAVVVFALRLIAGEDDWMCENGRWIAHGHPDMSAPSSPCLAAK